MNEDVDDVVRCLGTLVDYCIIGLQVVGVPLRRTVRLHIPPKFFPHIHWSNLKPIMITQCFLLSIDKLNCSCMERKTIPRVNAIAKYNHQSHLLSQTCSFTIKTTEGLDVFLLPHQLLLHELSISECRGGYLLHRRLGQVEGCMICGELANISTSLPPYDFRAMCRSINTSEQTLEAP